MKNLKQLSRIRLMFILQFIMLFFLINSCRNNNKNGLSENLIDDQKLNPDLFFYFNFSVEIYDYEYGLKKGIYYQYEDSNIDQNVFKIYHKVYFDTAGRVLNSPVFNTYLVRVQVLNKLYSEVIKNITPECPENLRNCKSFQFSMSNDRNEWEYCKVIMEIPYFVGRYTLETGTQYTFNKIFSILEEEGELY